MKEKTCKQCGAIIQKVEFGTLFYQDQVKLCQCNPPVTSYQNCADCSQLLREGETFACAHYQEPVQRMGKRRFLTIHPCESCMADGCREFEKVQV